MERLVQEVMAGERGLGSLAERAASCHANPSNSHAVYRALQEELEALASYFDARADSLEKLYGDIGLDGVRESRCWREVSQALRCRATGKLP